MARLGDIATYINGYAFKPTDWSNKGVPIIRIQDLTGNSYQANRYDGNYDMKYEVNSGDVLISWSASLGVYIWTGEKAVLNQHIFKVQFDKAEVDKSFFVHQVECILNKATGEAHGATMKHLTKPVFDALSFYLPKIEEQKQIANELNMVSDLISLRKQQLSKLDELVKSRFIELFGNILCDNNLPLVELKELADIGSSKRIYANEYVESGVPFYRSKEIRELGTGLKPSVELFIKQERYEEIKAKYGVPKIGDILIAAIGATIGYSWIVDTDKPFYYKDGNLIILSIKNNVNPIFLNHTIGILIEDFKSKGVAGSAQLALTIEKLEKMMVINPRIDLQNQFAAFVEQTDKSKFEIQKSLEKLETLKKALMQKYFG